MNKAQNKRAGRAKNSGRFTHGVAATVVETRLSSEVNDPKALTQLKAALGPGLRQRPWPHWHLRWLISLGKANTLN
jgi:hypothetical protein